MANPTAILEPKITLHSVEGDDVVLHASPEWKKKLADFIYYASTTRDVEVAPVIHADWIQNAREDVLKSSSKDNILRLHIKHILAIMPAFNALSVMHSCDFYDYDADDFDRLHDDFFLIYETVFKEKTQSFRRIKTGLSAGFDG